MIWFPPAGRWWESRLEVGASLCSAGSTLCLWAAGAGKQCIWIKGKKRKKATNLSPVFNTGNLEFKHSSEMYGEFQIPDWQLYASVELEYM